VASASRTDVFSPFPEKTNYFGDSTKQWMINFRVGDLDEMAGQLIGHGAQKKLNPPQQKGKTHIRGNHPRAREWITVALAQRVAAALGADRIFRRTCPHAFLRIPCCPY
jgi:hypothetical protein